MTEIHDNYGDRPLLTQMEKPWFGFSCILFVFCFCIFLFREISSVEKRREGAQQYIKHKLHEQT